MVNGHEEILLVDVTIESIVDGTSHDVDAVVIPRDELLIVEATGPRGNPTMPQPDDA